MGNRVEQAYVRTDVTAIDTSQGVTELALFNVDGTPWTPDGAVGEATPTEEGTVKQAAFQADFAGADITALKVELNAFLAKLKTAGIVKPTA